MSRIYDNWERIVGAVLLREQLRQTALCHSSSPSCSISSSTSSSFRLSVGSPHHDISVDFQQTFGDTIQLASQCIADDDDWERLLPLDYQEIVSRSVSPLNYATRKELYLKLCDFPILIDGGEMSFVLDKETGKKCFMIGGKGLKISPGAAHTGNGHLHGTGNGHLARIPGVKPTELTRGIVIWKPWRLGRYDLSLRLR
ncbi:UNVERIFIED_CONTAM: putative F-box protein PP2-B2 [Sesamum radiatum]|uniref:F-box protein PP2-B2 n=1 Tax=Sesamum radiatum TaxID=300843 RepID=A0AAW2JMM6_SESRA